MSQQQSRLVPTLRPGMRARFSYPPGERRYWWDVKAADDRFAVLTRQAHFEPKGTLDYTIIDWEHEMRGPCNLIGWGWGDGTYSQSECESILAEMNSGEIQITRRNNVPIKIKEVSDGSGY